MVGAALEGRRFRAVDFSDCSFWHAACRGILFEDVDLRGAQFRGACLERARFIRCDLTGTSFTESDVRSAEFIDCRGLSPRQAGLLTERQARVSPNVALPAGASTRGVVLGPQRGGPGADT
jgi:uncharacterized protein YjbI with pentapeptide repeats